MDIFQAGMLMNINNYRTLVHLNTMNKKNAFSVVRKERRKMDKEKGFKSISVMIAIVNLLEGIE